MTKTEILERRIEIWQDCQQLCLDEKLEIIKQQKESVKYYDEVIYYFDGKIREVEEELEALK